MYRPIVLPRQVGRALSALGGLLVLLSPAGAQAQLLRGILDSASGGGGVLGTGVTVGTTTPGNGLAGTGLTVGTAGGGLLGTGASVGTTAPGGGLVGTGLNVGTTGSGLLGTGVTVNTTGPGDGLLRTGLNIGTGGAGGSDPCNPCGPGAGGPSRGGDRTQTVVNELRLSSTAYAVATSNTSGLPSASATGGDATAVGYGATATGAGSVAIGAGARATRENQIVIGNSANTYTLPGIASQASAAAQSGATQFVTTDAGGNLAASPYGPSTIAGLGNRVDALEAKTDALRQYAVESRREARQGVATAMAMTTASMPSAPGRTSWVMNTATFRGEWAGGVALAHRLPTCCVPLAITAGYATSGGNNHGVRAGLAGEF